MSTEIFKAPSTMAESISCEKLEGKENVMHEPTFDDNHGERDWHKKEMISEEQCDITPIPTPIYAGEDLNLNSELVKAGFSAISIKHQPRYRFSKGCRWMAHSQSRANQAPIQQSNNLKPLQPRNSYPKLHHPELMALKWAKALTPENRKEVIEMFLHEHASYHGPFCSSFHSSSEEILAKTMLPYQMTSEVHIDSILSPVESKLEATNATDWCKENEDVQKGDSKIITASITKLDSRIEEPERENSQESDKIMDPMDRQRHKQQRKDEEDIREYSIQSLEGEKDFTLNCDTIVKHVCSETGATLRVRNANSMEVRNKTEVEKNDKTDDWEVIVAPISRIDSSIENVLLGNAQPSEEILDVLDLRRGTGSGEEGENEAHSTLLLAGEEDLQLNSDTEVMEVFGEAGAVVYTRRVTDEECGFIKMLRRSPARMRITLESAAGRPETLVVDNKEMAPFKSLQEVVVKKRDTGGKSGGNHFISGGENGILGSYFSTPETTHTEGSIRQLRSLESECTKTTKERANYINRNERESMESIEWERNNEWILPKEYPKSRRES